MALFDMEVESFNGLTGKGVLMMKMGRRMALLCAIVVLLLGLTACGEGSVTSGEASEGVQTGEGKSNEETATEHETNETDESDETSRESSEELNADKRESAENGHEEGDAEADEDGEAATNDEPSKTVILYYSDENLIEIVEEERDIEFKESSDLMTQMWQALQNPENEQNISLWADVELNNMELQDAQLTIDVTIPEHLQFGSASEGIAIQTLLQTYKQIDDVQSIQLLIDGQVQETLAGHVSIDQPLDVNEEIISTE